MLLPSIVDRLLDLHLFFFLIYKRRGFLRELHSKSVNEQSLGKYNSVPRDLS